MFSFGVTKTARGYFQVNAREIRKAFGALRFRETCIGRAEKKLAEATTPALREKFKAALEARIRERDYTKAKIENMLDFVQHNNLLNMTPQAVAKHAELRHLIAVKDDAFLAAQVAGRNSKSNDALQALVARCDYIISKFTSPRSTPLPKEDAISRAIQGVWDAALRYKPETSTAKFCTVAYNWIHRNTRARTVSDLPERGVLSLDDLMDKDKSYAKGEDMDDSRPRKMVSLDLRVLRAKHYNPNATPETNS